MKIIACCHLIQTKLSYTVIYSSYSITLNLLSLVSNMKFGHKWLHWLENHFFIDCYHCICEWSLTNLVAKCGVGVYTFALKFVASNLATYLQH